LLAVLQLNEIYPLWKNSIKKNDQEGRFKSKMIILVLGKESKGGRIDVFIKEKFGECRR